MLIVYIGPQLGGVDIAGSGQHADPHVPLEVEDELAHRLLEQDIWQSARQTASVDAAPVVEEASNGA